MCICIYFFFFFLFLKDNFHRNFASFKEKALGKKLSHWYSLLPIVFFSPLYDLSESTFFEEEIWIPVFSATKWFQQTAVCGQAHCLDNYQLWQSSTGVYFAWEIGRILRYRHVKQNFGAISQFPSAALIAGRVLSYGQRGWELLAHQERVPLLNIVCSFALLFGSCYLCV